ncbi:MAG: cytochrome P450, partial [Tepidiformaceae bacterium]
MGSFHPFQPAYVADPYPYLARLRATDPVHYSADMQGWVLTRYRDCERVLADPETFSSDPTCQAGAFGEFVRDARASAALGAVPILANSDAPEHGRLRAPVLGAFSPNQVQPRRESLAEAVGDLLEPLECGRPGDLVQILAEPLPLIALLEYIGVPVESRDLFRACVASIMSARMAGESERDPRRGTSHQAAEALRYLLRESPAESPILSRLREAVDAGAISEDEMLMLVVHIATAGNAATAFAIGSGLLTLARHPEAWTDLRADPSLVPGVVVETLRYDSPTHMI